MPRRGNVPKREILPDPMYNSVLVTKLVNSIMLDGKRASPRRSFTVPLTSSRTRPRRILWKCSPRRWKTSCPAWKSRPAVWAAATYQVPMEVRPARRQTLGLRWLTNYSRARGERTMAERLAGEIMDAANNTGSAVKKREDTHKMAESNKAFAHFRW
ncbi:MAG: 30S ribosomal protein S7 [Dysosmobacter sp.]